MDVSLFLKRDRKYYDDVQKFQWGEVAWIHQPSHTGNERMSIGLVTIFPNSKHERHFHFGEEQVLFVLEGSGIQRIDGRENIMKAGMIVHCPPYSEHEVINREDKDLKLLIIYTPAQFGEIGQEIYAINKENLLDNIDKEILEKIQSEVSDILNLSVVFLDNKKRRVTEETHINKFCMLCSSSNECLEETNKSLSSPLMDMHKVQMCKYNILTISAPIMIDNKAVGYIKCGHLLINRPRDIEKRIDKLSKENNLKYGELMDMFNQIPLVPKSRLYTLGEYLTMIAKYVSGIISNNIIEKEMIRKNNEIIEKTKETIYLENALKEANVKLLKSKVATNLNKINFNKNDLSGIGKINYPVEKEIELIKSITNLDKNNANNIIKDLFEDFKEKQISFNKAKIVIDEFFTVVSRTIYGQINDVEILHSLRNGYKNMLQKCTNQDDLLNHSLNFIENAMDILTEYLFQGEDELVKKVNLYIEKNYMKNLTLKSIAEVFYISPNYLSSLFNEKNGMSITDYININRVDNAKIYLVKTKMKISDIAKKVGYKNLSYFSYIFRKFEKCTPKEYRNKHSIN